MCVYGICIIAYIYIDVYSIHNMSSILQFFPTSMFDSSNYSMFQGRPEALPESGRDLDELAELVLSELQSLRHKVVADG